MSNWSQISTLVRFGLEQLSQRNGQHEFEHLCRHLSRARICANILPATGPVQSGGDQGRDFETFRSHLAHAPLPHGFFTGFTDKPIAFACSLNRDFRGKIQSDVSTIASSGSQVEEIHFFSSRDIPVATRHELQRWGREEHSVHLEIHDGAGVSEMLCSHDVFWIAEQFLNLPENLAPPLPEGEPQDWYSQTLDKWRRETLAAQTYADLVVIRSAARVARGPLGYDQSKRPVNRYEKAEFPFWLDRLDQIASDGAGESLRRRAFFEASVLRLRGLGTLVGQEERLRRYFAAVPQMTEPSELSEANSLLCYCVAANGSQEVHLEAEELESWKWALKTRIGERLQNTKRHGRTSEQCALLEILGNFEFNSSLDADNGPNFAAMFDAWEELARLAVDAPLFPLQRFSSHLAQGAEFFGRHLGYEPLTEAIDQLLGERVGAFAVAEKCLERAERFHKMGDLPRAMAQLHRAKINWFAPETLSKSLTALSYLSRISVESTLSRACGLRPSTTRCPPLTSP